MANPPDISGKEINGYRVVKPIGQGKFSVVYKGERISDGRIVALKQIKVWPEREGQIFDMIDPVQRDKCLKEVKLLQSVDHPHIIQYLDSFIANNELFISVEWAEKGDLKRVIKRAVQVCTHSDSIVQDETKLDEARVWDYVTQIAAGIQHMHCKRIMHRDLKPANIFITADGTLKVGDLGLGRFFSSQTYEAFSRVGTPLYMSPEVLSGNGYNWKSDVWSMGCIAYELAMLRSPFKADDAKMSLYELFQTISKGEYPPIDSRYSEELRSLIDMMLRLDPNERYDADQVMKICKEQRELVLKRPKIDPFLVMDDIIEKLRLLNYEQEFCKRLNRKPLSRIYFSHEEDPTHSKFAYFYELSYWLMSFSKKRAKLIGGLNEFNPDLNDDSKLKQLMLDLSTFGVKLPENTNNKQTANGYGEIVCYVINDLVNRELIRRNFKFEEPVFKDEEEKGPKPEIEEEEEKIDTEVVPASETISLAKYLRETGGELEPPAAAEDQKEEEEKEKPLPGPAEWQEEYKRVQTRLKEACKASDNEHYHSHIRRLTRYFKRVQDIMKESGNAELQNYVYVAEKALTAIAAHEKRLNGQTAPGLVLVLAVLEEMTKACTEKGTLAGELIRLRDIVKVQVEEFDTLVDKYNGIAEQVAAKSDELTNNSPVQKIKRAIEKVKEEIATMNLAIGFTEEDLYKVRVDPELAKKQ